MIIDAIRLSGEHIGKTVTCSDMYTGESVTSPLANIAHNGLTVQMRFHNRSGRVLVRASDAIMIREDRE